MEKRYQVFISSTFEDLQPERQEVIQALLELDYIPSGMELFPAADEDQWSLIKSVIDDCDYYLLIVGGRYGSTNSDGISYTEMEYRYALDTGKPIIAFLHKNPEELPAKKYEKSAKGKKALAEFRSLVKEKMCQFWDSPSDLGSKVSRSAIKLIKQHPAVGWVRADQLLSSEASEEILNLRKENDALNAELEALRTSAPVGTEDLAQGDSEIEVSIAFRGIRPLSTVTFDIDAPSTVWHRNAWKTTWNHLFYIVSPRMIDEAPEKQLRDAIGESFWESNEDQIRKAYFKSGKFYYKSLTDFSIITEDFQTVKVQLKALGLITKSARNRSVKDTDTYWTLTPYGETIMCRLRAVQAADG